MSFAAASTPRRTPLFLRQERGCIGGTIYLVGEDAKNGAILSDATSCSMCRRLIINAGLERVVIHMTPSEYTVVQVQDWIDQDDSIAEIELDGV